MGSRLSPVLVGVGVLVGSCGVLVGVLVGPVGVLVGVSVGVCVSVLVGVGGIVFTAGAASGSVLALAELSGRSSAALPITVHNRKPSVINQNLLL